MPTPLPTLTLTVIILFTVYRDESTSGLPFTVLSANSTAESVFGSICGQQLISSREELGIHFFITAIFVGNYHSALPICP